MPRIEAFEEHYKEYDEWFVKNEQLYTAEINAIKEFIPHNKYGMEIGVGTGKFAIPFGIKIGVEPSNRMADIAKGKGIEVYKGIAEQLPFENDTFDFVLMVTTICFIDDVLKSFNETRRVLKNNGTIIVGFVDKDSEMGKQYQAKKMKSKFYKNATFFGVDEVVNLLKESDFSGLEIKQTLIKKDGKLNTEEIKDGYGLGSFVAIKASK